MFLEPAGLSSLLVADSLSELLSLQNIYKNIKMFYFLSFLDRILMSHLRGMFSELAMFVSFSEADSVSESL